MEKALAYVVSIGIAGFGVWILIAGLSSGAPALWTGLALIPIAIGSSALSRRSNNPSPGW